MATCQNGWPASPNRENIVPLTVAGVSFPGGVRGGDVATVLGYVAEQFHRRVEALHAGWCWGYSYRDVRGSTDLSNHSGGYALDFNAPNHPLGKAGTFSAAQVNAIKAIVAETNGVVRWGGSYSGRKDEMHFEIVGNAASVKTVADRIRGGSTGSTSTSTSSTSALLKRGSNGDLVKVLQRTLNAWYPNDPQLAVDGDFGPATEAAVKRFQTRAKLVADGIAGPATLGALHIG